MCTQHHQTLIGFAERRLGGKWSRRGFPTAVVAACNSGGWTEVKRGMVKWRPDAHSVDPERRVVRTIEVGGNSDAKWGRILDVWWLLDCESWSLELACVRKDDATIRFFSDFELGDMWWARIRAYCKPA